MRNIYKTYIEITYFDGHDIGINIVYYLHFKPMLEHEVYYNIDYFKDEIIEFDKMLYMVAEWKPEKIWIRTFIFYRRKFEDIVKRFANRTGIEVTWA